MNVDGDREKLDGVKRLERVGNDEERAIGRSEAAP
jgi:hypothetical protein